MKISYSQSHSVQPDGAGGETKNKMKTVRMILSTLRNACVFFTVFALTITTIELSNPLKTIDPLRFFMLFPLALGISLSNLIFKAKKLNIFLRLTIHFLGISESFILCFRSDVKFAAYLKMLLLMGAIYIIIAAPFLIFFSIKNKKFKKQEEYVPVFTKRSKK